MNNNSIYSSFLETKTGSFIPVLKNGKTLESRYNPLSEAEKKINGISNCNFYIVLGICSGILIEKLLQKNPNCTIIGIENDESDIDFLLQSNLIKNLKTKPNIKFCSSSNLVQTLLNNYIPSFYGQVQIIENSIWVLENPETSNTLKLLINKSLEFISKDFSVQAHFGNLWLTNILNNIKSLNSYNKKNFSINIPLNKQALIVAAGPSLDQKIKDIKQNRNNYFIIATDTGFSTLLQNNIFCDCVFSIDSQHISYNHFIHDISKFQNTLFIFDLTGNHSICNKLIQNGSKVIFTINNHPLSNYINQLSNNIFPQIFSGSGTVTIAAFDFAVKCGFSNIKVLGADFSYINNKPYAQGTYLDTLYTKSANRLSTIEKNYSHLMYRIPVEIINTNHITTSVLKSYETSFIDYLNTINCNYKKENNEYIININNSNKLCLKQQKAVQINDILKEFSAENRAFSEKKSIISLKNTDICLLPLISWLRNNENIVEDNFSDLLKIAYSIILRFN